jgi:hypothetical protein
MTFAIARIIWFTVFPLMACTAAEGSDVKTCAKECGITIAGLQNTYQPGSNITFSLYNTSQQKVAVNVAIEGFVSGSWGEVVASVSDPQSLGPKIVKLSPIETSAMLDMHYDPWVGSDRATGPKLLRIRVDIYVEGRMTEKIRSQEMHLAVPP